MKTIFIGGSQRSGTTIIQKFICLDDATNPKIAEASYLRELASAYHNAKNDFDHDSASYFVDHSDLRSFHGTLVNLFLNRTLKRYSPARVLVLKEPHLTQYFPDLFELVPHCGFILIARDPRDIIASMVQVGERMKQMGQQHFFQNRNMAGLCQLVFSFYAPSLNSQNDAFRKRLMIVKYEEFVRNPDKTQQQIRQFTGLKMAFDHCKDPNQSLPDGVKADHPGQQRYAPWITQNNSRPINDSSVGSYKNILTDKEIAEVNQHLGSLLNYFNYSD